MMAHTRGAPSVPSHSSWPITNCFLCNFSSPSSPSSFPSVHNTNVYHPSLLLWLHSHPPRENRLHFLMSLCLVPLWDHARHLPWCCSCHLGPCPLACVYHCPTVQAANFSDFSLRVQRGQINVGSQQPLHSWLVQRCIHCVLNSLLLIYKEKKKTPWVHLCAESCHCDPWSKGWPVHFVLPSLDTQACATYSEPYGNSSDDNGYSGRVRCASTLDGVCLQEEKPPLLLVPNRSLPETLWPGASSKSNSLTLVYHQRPLITDFKLPPEGNLAVNCLLLPWCTVESLAHSRAQWINEWVNDSVCMWIKSIIYY